MSENNNAETRWLAVDIIKKLFLDGIAEEPE